MFENIINKVWKEKCIRMNEDVIVNVGIMWFTHFSGKLR